MQTSVSIVKQRNKCSSSKREGQAYTRFFRRASPAKYGAGRAKFPVHTSEPFSQGKGIIEGSSELQILQRLRPEVPNSLQRRMVRKCPNGSRTTRLLSSQKIGIWILPWYNEKGTHLWEVVCNSSQKTGRRYPKIHEFRRQ